MNKESANTRYPVTIRPAISQFGANEVRSVTETFSRLYAGHAEVPDQVIGELQELFNLMDGHRNADLIKQTNVAICAFCEFLIATGGGLRSLENFRSTDTALYFQFCQKAFPKGWRNRYVHFRSIMRQQYHLEWVSLPVEKKPTEGYSAAAAASMREALKKEIDRIREKIGRLDNDLKTGKVLDIGALGRRQPVKGPLTLNRADIIATIRHHLPDFPLKRNKKHLKPNDMTDVEWLLTALSSRPERLLGKELRKHFGGVEELIDYYFPTHYDGACILLHWGLLTGWNKQVISSVGVDSLNMRLRRNPNLETWSKDHAVLRAEKTQVFAGWKTRGQPRRKPKNFTHISDTTDPYGLFKVLTDFYALTQTVRFSNQVLEDNCIILGVHGKPPFLLPFGPGIASESELHPLSLFFERHKICDDGDVHHPQRQITGINWRQIRTTYETVLEDMGLPLYVRQKLLGHKSMDTSMFPYGSDMHATKIQHERLAKIIDEVHDDYEIAKRFQGALLPRDADLHKPRRTQGKVVQIGYRDWRDNIIMVCDDSRKPTWPRHEAYVRKGDECTFLGKCLLCKRCVIGRETLPHLKAWEIEIVDRFSTSGEWDLDMEVLELRQAINEVFALWRAANGAEDEEWAERECLTGNINPVPLDIWNIGGIKIAEDQGGFNE